MASIPLTTPTGTPITSVDSWTRPKSVYQWKPGRRAMELARAWFRGPEAACPAEVKALLDSHEMTRSLMLLEGRPGQVTPLPLRGEPRTHDLWLHGRTTMTRVTLAIEGAGDEPLGERLARQLTVARKRQPNTGLPERARALLMLLFGKECNPEALPWRELRYQLLTGLAAAALQAETDGSGAAVLIIHEFRTSQSAPDRLAGNAADLDQFVALLHPGSGPVEPGRLVGPIALPVSEWLPRGMVVFVGRVATEVREALGREG